MSDFDQEDIVSTTSGSDFDDADVIATEPAKRESAPDYSNVEVSQPEAFGVGAIQGSTLGTAPIASGIGGALMDVAEGIGDKLGLTTDSQLEKEGFTFPDKKTGLDSLLSEYYDSRDRMKGLQTASSEQYPLTTLAGNVTGGLPAALATGSSVAKTAGLGAKIAAGAKEGAALGGLASFGSGDADMFGEDGSVLDVAKETASGAVGGGLIGGAIPLAGATIKGTKNLVADLPIVGQLKTAFKGGTKGIKLNEESAGNVIKTFSEDLLNQIQSQFRKAGLSKANAMDYADEIGVRVQAGETFQDVMDDVISRGASSGDDLLEKQKLLKTLQELKDGPANKLADKLDLARAKMQQKMEAKGFELLDEASENGNVLDYVPNSGTDKNISLTKQTYQKIKNEPEDALEALTTGGEKSVSKPVEKLVQQAADNLPIDIRKYDLDNLSLRDLEEVIAEVNRHTGDLTGPAKSKSEQYARRLAGELRGLSEDAIDSMNSQQAPGKNILGNAGLDPNATPITSGNQSLHKTFAALNRAGIDDNVLTNNSVRKDAMVDKLRNTVTSGNSINRERMFQYLEESSPEYSKLGFKENAEFLNDFNELSKQVKPLNSTNVSGLLGSAKNVALSGANKLGQTGIAKGLTKLVELPAEQLGQLANKINSSNSQAVKQYVQPLLKASQSDTRKRSAILYGLYQQPAFRQMYEDMGEPLVDTITPVGTDRDEN